MYLTVSTAQVFYFLHCTTKSHSDTDSTHFQNFATQSKRKYLGQNLSSNFRVKLTTYNKLHIKISKTVPKDNMDFPFFNYFFPFLHDENDDVDEFVLIITFAVMSEARQTLSNSLFDMID
uniref:Uncharacterized protein n=1 Tax=Cacopsylla melanoneura TaxID=428564 RepID=A0A8D9BNX2_9HEMI